MRLKRVTSHASANPAKALVRLFTMFRGRGAKELSLFHEVASTRKSAESMRLLSVRTHLLTRNFHLETIQNRMMKI